MHSWCSWLKLLAVVYTEKKLRDKAERLQYEESNFVRLGTTKKVRVRTAHGVGGKAKGQPLWWPGSTSAMN